MTSAVKWVSQEVGAMFSQTDDYINVPELSLSRLVDKRNDLTAQLQQRDDTIAQLRAERDALARERDRLRKVIAYIEAALKGERTK